MYQSEFPVEQPVPVFDPTLLVGLALAALLIAALAFVAGRLVGRRERQGVDAEAPKTIHAAIKLRCVAASSAPSGELVRKTQELITEIEVLIGPLLAFGGPCAKVLAALKMAMEAKAPPEEKPHKNEGEAHVHARAAQPDTKSPGEGDGHAHGHSGHPGHGPGCRCDSCLVIAIGQAAPGLSIVGPRVGAQTVVITPPPPAPHAPHEPQPVEPKVLGHKDYIDQVRLAVIEVSDFWSRGECLAELQDCQRALNTAAPSALDRVGRRSGERAEQRLHNRQAKPDVSV